MGKQYNKGIKRARRNALIKRRKTAVKSKAKAKSKAPAKAVAAS